MKFPSFPSLFSRRNISPAKREASPQGEEMKEFHYSTSKSREQNLKEKEIKAAILTAIVGSPDKDNGFNDLHLTKVFGYDNVRKKDRYRLTWDDIQFENSDSLKYFNNDLLGKAIGILKARNERELVELLNNNHTLFHFEKPYEGKSHKNTT